MALAGRFLSSIFTIWLAVTLVFFALRVLPGDAIASQLAQGGVDAEVIDQRREEQGLNDPPLIQYVRYLGRLLQGDLGVSLLTHEPVAAMVARNIVPTAQLALGGLVVASLLGLGLGITSAINSGWGLSSAARIMVSLSLSAPVYFTGTLAIYLVTVQLSALRLAAWGRPDHLALPTIILGFAAAGGIARVTESSLRAVLNAEFVRSAHAKGLTERAILINHVLRIALLPTVRVIALNAGFLLGGTVITERLFVRPGLGRLLLETTIQQDYPVVQGLVILSAVVYSGLTGLADGISALLDPRVRHQS